LLVAAYQGHEKIVDRLLKNGADATKKENKGKTALELAKTRKHKEVLKVLALPTFKGFAKAGNISQAKKALQTFYEYAENKNTEIIKLYRTLLDDPKPDWVSQKLDEIDNLVLSLTKRDKSTQQQLKQIIGQRLFQDASKGKGPEEMSFDDLQDILEYAIGAESAPGAALLRGEVSQALSGEAGQAQQLGVTDTRPFLAQVLLSRLIQTPNKSKTILGTMNESNINPADINEAVGNLTAQKQFSEEQIELAEQTAMNTISKRKRPGLFKRKKVARAGKKGEYEKLPGGPRRPSGRV